MTASGQGRRWGWAAALWSRAGQKLLLVPLVAIASYALMALLPLPAPDDAKRTLPPEVIAAYRRDLGLGEPFGFLRPWQKLFRGERLGTSAQGVTGAELLQKLSGSAGVGAVGLGMALVGAFIFALGRRWLHRRGNRWGSDVVAAIVFGTPIFIPALLLAPQVVERGHFLPELAAAALLSLWPAVLLGRLMADALETELARDYVRTARSKGLSEAAVVGRHVVPNLLPTLLDSLPPIATSLLAGSFAVERVFGLPYFGQLYVLAVLQKQVAVVVVATTVFASVLVSVALAVELLRIAVDPRSRERA